MGNYKTIDVPFAQIPNELISDPSISWAAKGVYCYLASKPDGWQFYETEIQNNSSTGITNTRTAIHQLIEAGYLHRTPTRNELGHNTGYRYELVIKPHLGKPDLGFSQVGKSHTNNTNNNNTNNNNTEVAKATEGKALMTKGYPNKEITGIVNCRIALKWSKTKDERRWAKTLLAKSSYPDIIKLMKEYEENRTEPYMPVVNTLQDFYYKYPSIKAKLDTGSEYVGGL